MYQKIKYDTSVDEGSTKVLPSPPAYIPQPIWQPFPGFSFLFDNPGESLKISNEHEKIEIVKSALDGIDLYAKIAKAIDILDPAALAQRFQFFVLPFDTYHVTVWDGVNKGNINWLSGESKKIFDECFAGGVTSVLRAWPPFRDARDYTATFRDIDPIRFYYNGLRVRGTTVLVVELRPDPTDERSVRALAEIKRRRNELDSYFANYGKPENYSLIPHVAVGYFADSHMGRSALYNHMDTWMAVFDSIVKGSSIEFRTIDLYAFLDMVTYFKPRR